MTDMSYVSTDGLESELCNVFHTSEWKSFCKYFSTK